MALKTAWCAEQDGFLCAYTGVKVDEWDMGSPWAFCIDHAVSGDEGTLVVAAYWVNAVKTALTKDEFYIVLEELRRCWGEGREFRKDIASFDYWRNKPRRGRIWKG